MSVYSKPKLTSVNKARQVLFNQWKNALSPEPIQYTTIRNGWFLKNGCKLQLNGMKANLSQLIYVAH